MDHRLARAGFLQTRLAGGLDLRNLFSDRASETDCYGTRRYAFLAASKSSRVPFAIYTPARTRGNDADADDNELPAAARAWVLGDCFARQGQPNFSMVYSLHAHGNALHVVYEREAKMLAAYLRQVQDSYLAVEDKRARGLSILAQLLLTTLWLWDAGFAVDARCMRKSMIYLTTDRRHDYHVRGRVFRVRTHGVCPTLVVGERRARRRGGDPSPLYDQWMGLLDVAYEHGDAAGGGDWIQKARAVVSWARDRGPGASALPVEARRALGALAHLRGDLSPEDLLPGIFSGDLLAVAGVDGQHLLGMKVDDRSVVIRPFEGRAHTMAWKDGIHQHD